MDPDMDAVYLIAPEPYIVECLVADMESGRYRQFHLIWTSYLSPKLQAKLDNVPNVRSLIANFRILNIDFFPKESHLITFRDPYSFPVLFHPDCNSIVRKHMDELAQKVLRPILSSIEAPNAPRSSQYARPLANTPSSDSTDPKIHSMKLVYSARTSLALYKKASINMPLRTRTSPPHLSALAGY
jgi:Sec1 family